MSGLTGLGQPVLWAASLVEGQPGESTRVGKSTVFAVVTAEVKELLFHGPGASIDASSFDPANPSHFCVIVQALIGEVGDGRADSFDLTVCSPSWFAKEFKTERFADRGLRGMPRSVIIGSGIWFMERWNGLDVEAAVTTLCKLHSPAPDWGVLAARLGRAIPWEYDYRFDDHTDERFGERFPPVGDVGT